MAETNQKARGPITRYVEIVVALGIFSFGALVAYDSYRLGARWGDSGPQAGYFPFYVGLIMCFCSAVIVLRSLWVKQSSVFVDWEALRRVGYVLIPAGMYVLGVQLFGLYLPSALYIALFMIWLGKYAWWKALLVGVLTTLVFFFMFEVWFKVALYKGIYNPLSAIGY